MTKMQVHPAADLFPMMDDEALARLADSILSNGLRFPIVVDKNGVLIDGRNRLKACEIAGVEPTFTTLEGDPVDFIEDVNIERRDMPKGQKAMARAFLRPEAKAGRPKKGEMLSKSTFDRSLTHRARFVYATAPDIARSVLTGSATLDWAYSQAKAIEAEAKKPRDALDLVRQRYADLADSVVDGEMTIEQAMQKAEERDEIERNQRRTLVDVTTSAYRTIIAIGNTDFVAKLVERIRSGTEVTEELAAFMRLDEKDAKKITAEIERGSAALLVLIDEINANRTKGKKR